LIRARQEDLRLFSILRDFAADLDGLALEFVEIGKKVCLAGENDDGERLISWLAHSQGQTGLQAPKRHPQNLFAI